MSRGKVDLDTTRERLARLGLVHAAEQLAGRLGEAVKESVPPHRFLDELLEAELVARDERRIKTSLRLSGLPLGQTLQSFDFSFQPAVDRSRIETLATCAWIRETATLLLQGPPGVGKTHLAVALGAKAIENGFSVVFFRLEELLAALRRDADLPTSRLRQRKYHSAALLILDEVGFEPMSRQEARKKERFRTPRRLLVTVGVALGRKGGCRLTGVSRKVRSIAQIRWRGIRRGGFFGRRRRSRISIW